jgi:hypothetical protein
MPELQEELETISSMLFEQIWNKGLCMWLSYPIDPIILMIACEALVQLWFKAGPLQPLRKALMRFTPFLYSQSQEDHLLDCPYCCSVWAGFLLLSGYVWLPTFTYYLAIGLAIHRLSNHFHLVFSYIRDLQFDRRVKR